MAPQYTIRNAMGTDGDRQFLDAAVAEADLMRQPQARNVQRKRYQQQGQGRHRVDAVGHGISLSGC
jgi:hypothetical protein